MEELQTEETVLNELTVEQVERLEDGETLFFDVGDHTLALADGGGPEEYECECCGMTQQAEIRPIFKVSQLRDRRRFIHYKHDDDKPTVITYAEYDAVK